MDKQDYMYQENLAFQKELSILRNDFYYQYIESKEITLVDFMYKPYEIMSGDAYTARRISEHKILYLIVDGMGKGLSASLTAMIITTFINHTIDKMIKHESFSFDILIQETIEFIKPILLDEEALAIDFICFNAKFHKLHYAKFAMPPLLLQDKDNNIIKLKSNNPPLSKWQKDYKISTYDVESVSKFLFYSDGIVENRTQDGGVYSRFIEEDFKHSFTREEFKEKFFSKLADVEDDLTLIFLNKLPLQEETTIGKKEIESSFHAIEKANEWYDKIWNTLTQDNLLTTRAEIVFNELLMNAYEHGNLGIKSEEKHAMLENDTYIDGLLALEKQCSKKIYIQIYKVQNVYSQYIVTEIRDEGEGFDTQLLSTIFRNSQKFNGRGVYVSRKNSMGIYYNKKGNRVLFLNKL